MFCQPNSNGRLPLDNVRKIFVVSRENPERGTHEFSTEPYREFTHTHVFIQTVNVQRLDDNNNNHNTHVIETITEEIETTRDLINTRGWSRRTV